MKNNKFKNLPFQLHLGDCIAVMRSMADSSVDSIVTDPPYELGFMGKKWDSTGIANSVEMWTEALRVLKPGGHLLAFSGSRTYHRMACAIEDAGFDIRDQVMWVYGSGFPKSLNVSKAIDKARVEDIEPVRVVCRAIRAAMDRAGLKSRDLSPHFDNCHPRLIDHWAARDTDSQPSLPTMAQWALLRALLKIGAEHDLEVSRLNCRKGSAGDVYANAEVIGEHDGATPGFAGERFSAVDTSIRDQSDAARQWDGWGTALKPSHEPICVARKPLAEGTVAANVLAHGTGAINIDGCRVGTNGEKTGGSGRKMLSYGGANHRPFHDEEPAEANTTHDAGRWPANIIHDGSDEVVALFPNTKSGIPGTRRKPHETGSMSGTLALTGVQETGYGDTGSAARFFYCAKTSRTDRNEGLTDPGPQFEHGTTLRKIEDAPKAGNTHPTVKPTDLMAYLCRLVTPPGGTVLDPFMGSGSTGKACMREGFQFIGIDMTAEYHPIAEARIAFELERAQEAATAKLIAEMPPAQMSFI